MWQLASYLSWVLSEKIPSGNRLPFMCNRLQGSKIETGRSVTSGNRLPIVCNQLHSVTFRFQFEKAV